MRQRHIKHATEDIMISMGVQFEITRIHLDPSKKIYVEIGSGKGQFITSLAHDFPEIQFVAIEKDIDVCYRIAEKRVALDLKNLFVVNVDAIHVDVLFHPSSIDMIYLNFSDPWPKKKHHKRRLTAEPFVITYQKLLKKEGMLQLRTDHYDFFIDSKETLSKRFLIDEIDFDYPKTLYMTEYEEKKRDHGPIYQLRGKVIHDTTTLS